MKENENVMENDDEIEIDLGGIFHALLHWLWLILVVALAAGVLGYSIARFVLPAEYESTTSIYVLDRSSGESTTYSDLQVSSQLTADYQELIKSRYVIEKTIDDLDLASQGFTYDSLYRAISVESPSNTHILVVTVTDTDPERAQKICNEVREVAAKHIQNVMKIDAVNIVDEANRPEERSSPSYSKWTAVCAAIGALIVAIAVFVKFITDDTIKTTEDVEKYLGLYTLAVIPLDETVTENSIEGQRGKKKRKPARRKISSKSHSSHAAAMSSHASDTYTHAGREQALAAEETEKPRNKAPRRPAPKPAVKGSTKAQTPDAAEDGVQDDYITIE